jgi:hypothetical protein
MILQAITAVSGRTKRRSQESEVRIQEADNINYHLGTMNDYPSIQCILNKSPQGYSTYGACGVREDTAASRSGMTAGAIFNATGK